MPSPKYFSKNALNFYRNNEPRYLIECQGQQHYSPVEFFGGYEQFEQQQLHDELKKEYAEELGIPLLEIPYTYTNAEVISYLKNKGI